MKYCAKCGKDLMDEAVICVGCGCPVNSAPAPAGYTAPVTPPANLLNTLATRVHTDAIIWVVIGAVQLLLGIFVDWYILIIGALNVVAAIQDFRYSKAVLTNPTGIVKKYEPLVWPIITMVYNLLFGGIIGVGGSIYYLIAVRGFVMQNRDAFAAMDNSTDENTPTTTP